MSKPQNIYWTKFRKRLLWAFIIIVALPLLYLFGSKFIISPNEAKTVENKNQATISASDSSNVSFNQLNQQNNNKGDVKNEFIEGDKIEGDKIIYNNVEKDSSNSQYTSKYKMYLVYAKILSTYNKMFVQEYYFSNPDNVPVRDVEFTIENTGKFDTAYLNRNPLLNNGKEGFDKKGLRDAFCRLSPDKKVITFMASYIGANQTVRIILIKRAIDRVSVNGVGKLF